LNFQEDCTLKHYNAAAYFFKAHIKYLKFVDLFAEFPFLTTTPIRMCFIMESIPGSKAEFCLCLSPGTMSLVASVHSGWVSFKDNSPKLFKILT